MFMIDNQFHIRLTSEVEDGDDDKGLNTFAAHFEGLLFIFGLKATPKFSVF